MSSAAYDELIDEYADIIGYLTPHHVEELEQYLKDGDVEAAHMLMNFLSKSRRVYDIDLE